MKTPLEKSLRQRALEYLGKREYSYTELGQKLKAYAEEGDDVAALLEDFKQRGWISDARFTEQIVHARQAKFGSARIAHELREKGVADHLIQDAIEQVKDHELDNATEVWRKKFKASPKSREEWAKQARFLQSRGFGFDLIKKVLSNTDDA
ncbi:MAG: recombination regulator RecX [Methylotenera sp. 24-45-7]|nr:MAG: recombination regulator RecX [Methylotenera sp. 24-45-7]OZA08539.1 MAG: recombination regulator RecX [Methylotenera sp. 17-45-7]OZA53441.1 MAG: recombination regulator RecX [Methylophilales bacterium 39-45-7]HQS37736.1 recombination regulator RecX [Methylotenera sp.]HQS42849.1 recombination regulator RecX [Methylotenera sp.]